MEFVIYCLYIQSDHYIFLCILLHFPQQNDSSINVQVIKQNDNNNFTSSHTMFCNFFQSCVFQMDIPVVSVPVPPLAPAHNLPPLELIHSVTCAKTHPVKLVSSVGPQCTFIHWSPELLVP